MQIREALRIIRRRSFKGSSVWHEAMFTLMVYEKVTGIKLR